jgi:hypothetical protein
LRSNYAEEWALTPPELRMTDPDDPPVISKLERFAFIDEPLPTDPLWALIGLPHHRFVSEEFFDAVMCSGLYQWEDWSNPFTFLRWDEMATYGLEPGWRGSKPPEERIPWRLNGRQLCWGGPKLPLHYPRDAAQSIGGPPKLGA